MCGIFGTWNARKAAELTGIGLHAIQHRGVDYAGIVPSHGAPHYRHSGRGLAREVFPKERLDVLHGKDALGHIRYPTVSDNPALDNTQPIVVPYAGSWLALAHNGNLTNTEELRAKLGEYKLKTSMDSELIALLLSCLGTSGGVDDLLWILPLLKGSFALGILTPDRLIAARDASGNRPLSVGIRGESYFIASETCALDAVGADFLCDVKPGTILEINKDGPCESMFAEPELAQCRFEGIYFAHPASTVFSEPVSAFRVALGKKLEELSPALGADIVVPVPDSSNLIAFGYGQSGRSGMYFPAITRSHYVGRTFIVANQELRDEEIAQKFSISKTDVAGKSIVLVDDSIVRLTTLPILIRRLRDAGTREIHVRIGCPPITHPCRYGINTPTRQELAAANFSPEEIRESIGVETLQYMTLPGLASLSRKYNSFCYACMTGTYPIE